MFTAKANKRRLKSPGGRRPGVLRFAAEFSKPHGTSRGFSTRNAPQLYLFQCGFEFFE